MKETISMELECNRCGHKWLRRILKSEPKRCPGCKSIYWNKLRVRITPAMKKKTSDRGRYIPKMLGVAR